VIGMMVIYPGLGVLDHPLAVQTEDLCRILVERFEAPRILHRSLS
jgi:hypothetical protein